MMKTCWLSKWKPSNLETKLDICLTRKQEMDVVKKVAKLCPELLKVLLENPKWKCPFPFLRIGNLMKVVGKNEAGIESYLAKRSATFSL